MVDGNQDIAIRFGELRDAETIADFSTNMARETDNLKLDRKIVVEGVKSVIMDSAKGFYLVAEDVRSRRLVGQLAIAYEWSDWSNSYFWLMQGVWVEKDYRRQKIFSRLYKRLTEIALEKGNVAGMRLYVKKNNGHAQKVYRSLGIPEPTYDMLEVEFAPHT